MTEKYKVTREFMNALINWRDERDLDVARKPDGLYVNGIDMWNFTNAIDAWWLESTDRVEHNNRLIAIIKWLNGEDVFEIEKPHKFVVRSTAADEDGDYRWMYMQGGNYNLDVPFYNELKLCRAKRFNTRMDAELWTTNGYEVVEIDGDGKEVTE